MSGMCTQHLGWKVPAAMLLISSFAWAQAPGSPTRASRGGVEAPSSPPLEAVRSAVRQYRQQHEVEIVRGYAELLSLPNVASDTANINANAERIKALLQGRGFQTQ